MSMELKIFKTLWGHTGGLDAAIAACSEHVFDGLEGQAPATSAARADFRIRLAEHRLGFIAEICTAGGYVPDRHATVSEHFDSLLRQAEAALQCQPLFLNIIAGCDAWSVEQSVDFFGQATDVTDDLGITASFETHRSRSFFNPWITRDILEQLPELKLTCDFSHWCVVCERLVDSESDVITLCAERAHHVHARVGYDQGAQVPHPAAPEYREALEAHERWWAQIWRNQLMRSFDVTTMTPEFGPDGYMHCLPFTGAPVADLAQVNVWMAERQRRRFAEWLADANQLNLVPIEN
jgi:hypothetical protein